MADRQLYRVLAQSNVLAVDLNLNRNADSLRDLMIELRRNFRDKNLVVDCRLVVSAMLNSLHVLRHFDYFDMKMMKLLALSLRYYCESRVVETADGIDSVVEHCCIFPDLMSCSLDDSAEIRSLVGRHRVVADNC